MNTEINDEICKLEKQLSDVQSKLTELHQKKTPEEVTNYEFDGISGKTNLLELFGDKEELIVIHNMGPSCPYCTLWADGFNGFSDHFQSRAAFALTAPTDFKSLSTFADKRGWRFPYYSTITTKFQEDMGVCKKDDNNEASMWPAVSTFFKKDNKIFRQTSAGFGPGDLYCSIWHFFNLLPKSEKGWNPKFSYN